MVDGGFQAYGCRQFLAAHAFGVVRQGPQVIRGIDGEGGQAGAQLFEDAQGRALVLFAFVWSAIGIYLIRRIIRIQV